MKCLKCGSDIVVKNGKNRIGFQRYRCKSCLGSFQTDYRYSSCLVSDRTIVALLKESVGIRGIGRILSISANTVIHRILKIARTLQRPFTIRFGEKYQVDELFTYVGNKDHRVCVAYSYNPKTEEVVDIVVGKRNKTNLNRIVSTLILSNASRITTDKLAIYRDLIPSTVHSTKCRGINHIERQNLNLRTHLKRLNRRTICFSKSAIMLFAVVKIYFWS